MEDNYFEQQLFSWKDWQDIGIGSFVFNDCVLKKDFHNFKKGTKFDWCNLDLQKSIIEFGNDSDKKIHSFNIILDTTTTSKID